MYTSGWLTGRAFGGFERVTRVFCMNKKYDYLMHRVYYAIMPIIIFVRFLDVCIHKMCPNAIHNVRVASCNRNLTEQSSLDVVCYQVKQLHIWFKAKTSEENS